ncbi:hypothetical protein CRUP_018273 [Coryphaenoides rupestris]|nr:hypothetical protein CRUP_018273 [Coryphaenoides rupestris]
MQLRQVFIQFYKRFGETASSNYHSRSARYGHTHTNNRALLHVTNVASNGEHLNRECSLFTDDCRYVIVGSATYVPEDPPPYFFEDEARDGASWPRQAAAPGAAEVVAHLTRVPAVLGVHDGVLEPGEEVEEDEDEQEESSLCSDVEESNEQQAKANTTTKDNCLFRHRLRLTPHMAELLDEAEQGNWTAWLWSVALRNRSQKFSKSSSSWSEVFSNTASTSVDTMLYTTKKEGWWRRRRRGRREELN